MTRASRQADARAEPWIDRLLPWISAFLSASLHLLLLFLAMLSPPVTVTTPQGAAAGGRMFVDFIGVTPPQPTDAPAASAAAASEPAETAPAVSRTPSPPVTPADDPVPADDATDELAASSVPQPMRRPDPPAPASPPGIPDAAAQGQAPAPAASPPPTPLPRQHTWGQPPGMLQEDLAPVNAGPARSPTIDRGRRNDTSSAEPNLEVGGYQVYYDLRSETRLSAWRDEGMTEIFILLPGTVQYMVCPLETALRRDSGACRLLDPDAPELETIGDAREVIHIHEVYRQGERIWRGPGPYR